MHLESGESVLIKMMNLVAIGDDQFKKCTPPEEVSDDDDEDDEGGGGEAELTEETETAILATYSY